MAALETTTTLPPPLPQAPEALSDCPVCKEPLEERVRSCERCDTPHHEDCWDYSEGCSVFACKPSSALDLVPSPALVLRAPSTSLRERVQSGLSRLAQVNSWQWALFGGWVFVWAGFLAFDSLVPWGLGLVPARVASLISLFGLLMVLDSRRLPPLLSLLAKQFHSPQAVEETPLKTLEARLSEAPKNLHVLEALADGLQAQGRPDRALGLYQEALSIHPREHRIRYRLARCLVLLGEVPQARTEFHTLIRNAPESGYSDLARRWLARHPEVEPELEIQTSP